MKGLALAMLLALPPGPAMAAAWTQKEDSWQLIGGLILSDADASFDGHGNPSTPASFQRLLFTTDTAYGWDDDLTLVLRSETAYAHIHDGVDVTAVNTALEAGVRYRLEQGLGLLAADDLVSVEATARTAGAFNFAYSANAGAAGHDAGLRLLYGSGFQWNGRDGFIDVELGQRWLSPPRPDQTALDVTAGLWLDGDWMVMAQSFNTVSGPAAAPYRFFRSHKLQLSGVWKVSPRFSLQAGGFFSPAGLNALDERGLCLSLWARF